MQKLMDMVNKVKSATSNSDADDETLMLHLNYSKVPMTMELRRRQRTEQIMKRQGIHKKKTGILL